MAEFHLQIVTPDGLIFDGGAESLHVRADTGDIEIMRGHEDYFSTLGTGRARLTTKEGSQYASASGGFLSVRGGEVKLVCTTFEFADKIDLERAKKAKEISEETIKSSTDERVIRLAKAKLSRALNRINVAELK